MITNRRIIVDGATCIGSNPVVELSHDNPVTFLGHLLPMNLKDVRHSKDERPISRSFDFKLKGYPGDKSRRRSNR